MRFSTEGSNVARATHLCVVIKVPPIKNLPMVLCCPEHNRLNFRIIRQRVALPHGARGHELGAVGVVNGVLQ